MNDFTIEELEILSRALKFYVGENAGREIQSKIQSMIDNYPKCDHRSGMNHYNEKGEAVGYDSDIYRCRHCDILFRFTFENGQCVGTEELE